MPERGRASVQEAVQDGVGSSDAKQATVAAAPISRWIGAFEVVALCDAVGQFMRSSEAFPGASEAAWSRARAVDPRAVGADGWWRLEFRSFAIRRPNGRVILVDAGVGPGGSPAAAWAPAQGLLPTQLAAAGIDLQSIDTVVLTHLHSDHAGWAVTENGLPFFEEATYLVQATEIRALEASRSSEMLDYAVTPLRATRQLREIDGQLELPRCGAGIIMLVPTPGHTPGHQSVVIESRARQMVITGDVLVHALQLVDPDVGYLHEADQALARLTRRNVLARARARKSTLATMHLSQPFFSAEGRDLVQDGGS
ncbi:MBL fold metallo-hydrolase [Kribbella swartbergensis]